LGEAIQEGQQYLPIDMDIRKLDFRDDNFRPRDDLSPEKAKIEISGEDLEKNKMLRYIFMRPTSKKN
jgi:hypothetical protein